MDILINMSWYVISLVPLAVAMLGFLSSSLVFVGDNELVFVERFRRFHRILDSGIYIVFPFIESFRTVNYGATFRDHRVFLHPLIYDPRPIQAASKEKWGVSIDLRIQYKIIRPEIVVNYRIIINETLLNSVQTKIVKICNDTALQELQRGLEGFLKNVMVEANETLKESGLQILSLDVQKLGVDKGAMSAQEAKNASETQMEIRNREINNEIENAKLRRTIHEALGEKLSRHNLDKELMIIFCDSLKNAKSLTITSEAIAYFTKFLETRPPPPTPVEGLD